MQLLQRYLAAVKLWLPKAQRDDITAELAANLQSEIDDRAAALGRPASDFEIATLLKQHGAPILVASRYRQEKRTVTLGRQLVGPILFPFYWIAIKVTLVLICLTSIIPPLFSGAHDRLTAFAADSAVRIAHYSLPALALVTILFALLDLILRKSRFIERRSENWDPRNLPSAANQAKQVRRSSSITGIIIQTLFLIWWWNHGTVPSLVASDTGTQIHLAPVLAGLHLPILVIMFINLAQHCINLAKPSWRWLPPLSGFLTSLAALVIFYPLLWISPLVSISDHTGAALDPHRASQLASLVSLAVVNMCIGIAVVATIYACRLGWLIWQIIPRGKIERHSLALL